MPSLASTFLVTILAAPLTVLATTDFSQPTYLKAPDVVGHGDITAEEMQSRTFSELPPQCDFTGDGLPYHYVFFSDETCFGWNNANQCSEPWSLCETSLGLHCMDAQTSTTAPTVETLGSWIGAFEGQTTSFKYQDILSFEEAMVIANGHNQRMHTSTETFNDIEWEKAAGASTYYWGTSDGSVASVTRKGKDVAEMCKQIEESACDAVAAKLEL